MKTKFNFIHPSGKVERLYVKDTEDFEFIESIAGPVKYKFNRQSGRKEAYVYVDDASDSEFISSVVSMLRYEINNNRVQEEWCVGNQDDPEFTNHSAQDNTFEEALHNIERAAVKAAVRAAARKLDTDEQYLINRLYLDPIPASQKELAEELHVTENTIKTRAADIREKLRILLRHLRR